MGDLSDTDLTTILLSDIIRLIEVGNSTEFRAKADLLQLDKLSLEYIDKLLILFLTHAMENGQDETAKAILDYFDNTVNQDDTRIPNFTYLFTLPQVDDKLLRYLIKIHEDRTAAECLEDLINWKDDDNTRLATQRVLDLYKVTEEFSDMIGALLESVREDERGVNTAVEEVLSAAFSTMTPFAEKPNWVKDFTGEDELPYEDEIVLPEPEEENFDATDQAALEERLNTLIKETIEQMKFSGEQGTEIAFNEEETSRLEKELRERLALMSQQEKKDLVESLLKSLARTRLQKDEDYFVVLGPVNPQYGVDLSQEGRCTTYGGCRMFTCLCGLDEEETEWFAGSCDRCNKRIRNKYWAVRAPSELGGWRGSYCSWVCAREDNDDNKVILGLIDIMEEDINRIGIQDRLMRTAEKE